MSRVAEVLQTVIVAALAIVLLLALVAHVAEFQITERLLRSTAKETQTALGTLCGSPEALESIQKLLNDLKEAQTTVHSQATQTFWYGITLFVLTGVSSVVYRQSSSALKRSEQAEARVSRALEGVSPVQALTAQFLLAHEAAGRVRAASDSEIGNYAPALRDYLRQIDLGLREAERAGFIFDASLYDYLMLDTITEMGAWIGEVQRQNSRVDLTDLLERIGDIERRLLDRNFVKRCRKEAAV